MTLNFLIADEEWAMHNIVFFSSQTGNTHAFVKKLGLENNSIRLPAKMIETVYVSKPYILFVPTYAANDGRGALPKSVVKFLNVENNRDLLRGIVASGNKNFGSNFCLGAEIISKKCDVPILYRYELRGTMYDVANVMDIFNA